MNPNLRSRRQGLSWLDMPRPKERKCRCGSVLPFTKEHFPVVSKMPWGLGTLCRKCNNATAAKRNRPERASLRLEVLTHYGKNGSLACCCCGEPREEFLTLDHENGGGTKERKKYPATMLFRRLRRLGFPKGYRTLCYNCNCSIGMRGYCPHAKEMIR